MFGPVPGIPIIYFNPVRNYTLVKRWFANSIVEQQVHILCLCTVFWNVLGQRFPSADFSFEKGTCTNLFLVPVLTSGWVSHAPLQRMTPGPKPQLLNMSLRGETQLNKQLFKNVEEMSSATFSPCTPPPFSSPSSLSPVVDTNLTIIGVTWYRFTRTMSQQLSSPRHNYMLKFRYG